MDGCIFNIQKFSLHDGPGIRTVVFFKGCPLRCPWCANPESQNTKIQVLWDEHQCTKCFQCIKNCKAQNISYINNRIHVAYYDENEDYHLLCPFGALQKEGEKVKIDTIMKEVLKDFDFYEESGGGVTLSGGEVLSQAKFAIALCKELKKHKIHIAIETTGYSNPTVFNELIEHIDLLLYDLKHYDLVKHQETCGVSNEMIIHNLKNAIQKEKEIIVRIPIIPGFNDQKEDALCFSILLKELGITKVNLLPFHQLGANKYTLLGLPYEMENVKQLHSDDLEEYKNIMISEGLSCTV